MVSRATSLQRDNEHVLSQAASTARPRLPERAPEHEWVRRTQLLLYSRSEHSKPSPSGTAATAGIN